MKRCYYCLLLSLFLTGCGRQGPVSDISEVRVVDESPDLFLSIKSSDERFGSNMAGNSHDHHDHEGIPFDWMVPKGWGEKAPTQMRMINLSVGGNPEAECYLTILQGEGGGLKANINRWRSQMSLPALSDDEIINLPKKKLLGQNAVYVSMSGTFSGMSGQNPRDNFMLVGLILEHQGISIFVKMVGPNAVIRPELVNFETFTSTLKLKDTRHDHDHGASAQSTPKKSQPFEWQIPEHWIEKSGSKMRLVTYSLGSDSNAECYVVILPGPAGGMTANINRWYKQMGHNEKSSEFINELPEIDILKNKAKLVEITGNYTDMGGNKFQQFMMLGVIFGFDGQSVFIKMTGPEADVRTEQSNFMTFCQSFKAL